MKSYGSKSAAFWTFLIFSILPLSVHADGKSQSLTVNNGNTSVTVVGQGVKSISFGNSSGGTNSGGNANAGGAANTATAGTKTTATTPAANATPAAPAPNTDISNEDDPFNDPSSTGSYNARAGVVPANQDNPDASTSWAQIQSTDPKMVQCLNGVPGKITAAQSCQSAAKLAMNACIGNSNLQWAMAAIGGLSSGSGLAGMGGANDACKSQNAMLTVAETAVAAYNTACGAAQAACAYSCSGITAASVKNLVSVCSDACGGYLKNVAAAGVAMAQFAKSKMDANKCAAETSTAAAVDCTQAANASSMTCVCLADPNASGCSTATTAAVTTTQVPITAAPSTAASSGIAASGAAGVPMDSVSSTTGTTGTTPTTSTSSGTSAITSGGVPIGSVTSAAATTAAKTAVTGQTGSGVDGSSYGSGGSSGSAAAPSKFSQYLPGGTRNVASAPADISSKAGKSNWEKVKQAYFDVSAKLINK